MSRELVFVHGRSQQKKDAVALKTEWIEAFEEGLAKSGLRLPIPATSIRFPFYGDTLYELTEGKSADEAADVIVRGTDASEDEKRFVRAVLEEVRQQAGITDEQMAEIAGQEVITKGPLNWEWLQTVLEAVDRYVPHGSGAGIALATRDVYTYLKNAAVRQLIDDGVSAAMTPGVDSVVVSHSLGTVVAYNLLRQQGVAKNWSVPLFVTLGSPLAVSEIRKTMRGLGTIRCPQGVSAWFNAFDPRDVVALFPLDVGHFALDPVDPSIENKSDVRNRTDNRHGIAGYLDDKDVARRIYDALKA